MAQNSFSPTLSQGADQKAFLNDLKKAINGEYSAIVCYEHIMQMAPTQEVKSRVSEIREDEIRHYNTFQYLYDTITGSPLKPEITEQCPTHYRSALHFAFQDEQITTDFYNQLSHTIQNQSWKQAFSRAARDEQNHAVWFLYFLMNAS